MTDKDFTSMINRIAALKKIKNIALHTIEDRDEPEYDRISVRVEDETGEVLEIRIHNPVLWDFAYETDYHAECVLVNLLIQRLFYENGVDGNQYWQGINMDVWQQINFARKILPYTGVNWLNEKESRLYDHVQPEKIF